MWFKWLLELGERPVKKNDCWTRDWQTSLFHSAKRWLFHIDNYPVHLFSVPRLTFLPCTSSLGQLHVYQNGIWPFKENKAQKKWSMNLCWSGRCSPVTVPSVTQKGYGFWDFLCKDLGASSGVLGCVCFVHVWCDMCELWDMWTWVLHYFFIGMISKFCNTVA